MNSACDPLNLACDDMSPPAPRGPATPSAHDAVECFTPGTQIATRGGPKLVEDLRMGDMLLTRDNGFQPLLWRGTRRMRFAEAQTRPVHIEAGALGPGQPARATVLSPSHKVLRSAQAARQMAPQGAECEHVDAEVLIEAQALVGALPGVRFIEAESADYVHLLLAQHEVILSNGAWMESFRLGRAAAAILRAARCAPVLAAFPNLREDAPATLHSPARCILPSLMGFGGARAI